MKIFDMHIHTSAETPNPEKLIKAFEEAGIYGGCVFSQKPLEMNPEIGRDFEGRVEQVLAWSKGYEDRIFPVLWIHPDEENIEEKIKIAVERGVAGFKVICNDFHVYEEKSMKMLRAIAKEDKPVFFHSGILYMNVPDPEYTKYNRPLDWEAMLKIPGLRFSMGHCSYPWIDECIALYGRIRFYKAFLKEREECAEMFFDITPGTPDSYREYLLTKLYLEWQDPTDYIMFGTDQAAENYKPEGGTRILELDRKILDKLGVSKACREKMYYHNLLRFLGKTQETDEVKKNRFEKRYGWSSYNKDIETVIRKWYKKLEFPGCYDNQFEQLLANYKISDAITIEKYNFAEMDGKRNLLSFLYFCEDLERRYKEKGIDEKILIDTLKDLPIWTTIWSDVKNELCLFEIPWLKRHLNMELFKIGCLEFCMNKSYFESKETGLEKGMNMIEIHIAHGSKITPENVEKSLKDAVEFFDKYYPEFEYEHFTFESWLMDPTLKKFLKPESNILKLQERFVVADKAPTEAYSALRYVFEWNTNELNVRKAICTSSFAEKMKKHVLDGGTLFVVASSIKKSCI